MKKYKILKKNYPYIFKNITKLIWKAKISKKNSNIKLSESEQKKLQYAKEICELEINNHWDERNSKEFALLCAAYFDISTCFNYDLNDKNDISELLKIIIFGYLGGYSFRVKNYLLSIEKCVVNTEIPEKWDERIFYVIFESLYFIIIGNTQENIKKSIKKISQLKIEQIIFENNFLSQIQDNSRPYVSAELVSLYYFIKSIELFYIFLLERNIVGIDTEIEYYLETASKFAKLCQNISFILLYKYFNEFFIKSIKKSK